MEVQRALGEPDGVAVLAVLPVEPPRLRELRAALDLRIRLLSDPARTTFPAYGFRRGSFRAIWLSGATWLSYGRLIARGRVPHWPTEDARWLGGDVLVDRVGRIAWAHRSRDPSDRPGAHAVVSRISAELAAPTPSG